MQVCIAIMHGNPVMLERFRIVSDEEFGRLEDRIEAEGRNAG